MHRWIVVALSLIAAAPAAAQGPLKVEPITFTAADGQAVAAEAGEIWVPEDRADPKSRRIKLAFVRFKSTAAIPGPPLIYLAGGPGASGIQTAKGRRFPVFMALRNVGDVIALDQRGVGASGPLPLCTDRPPTPSPDGTYDFTREAVIRGERELFQRCWTFWRDQGIAIEGYNTWESAADIDDLRQALGAKTVNLWGISYGSHLGLAFAKRFPERLNRIALSSLEGLDQTVKLPAANDEMIGRFQRVIDAQPAARAAYPDLLGLVRRVNARLDREPAVVALPAAAHRPAMRVRFDSFLLQLNVASALLADPAMLARLPALYVELDAGRYDQAILLFSRVIFGRPPGLDGMSAAMDLASGVSSARLAQVRNQARTAAFGDALNFPMPHVIGAVRGRDLGDEFRRPFHSNVPALFISGDLDGRTALTEQRIVARQFANPAHILVENGGHNLFEAHPDFPEILTGFFHGRPVTVRRLVLPPPVVTLP